MSTRRIVFIAMIHLGALLLAPAGCGHADTQYYFAAANLDDATRKPKVTFYRVTFKGSSFGAKTNLQEGFYDSDALHELFGEVKQASSKTGDASSANNSSPDLSGASGHANTSPPPTINTGTFELHYDPVSEQWSVVNKERFTIIYGGNADALASQIKAFAEDSQLGQDIGQIISGSLKNPKKSTTKPSKTPVPKPSPPPKTDPHKSELPQAQKTATVLAQQLADCAKNLTAVAGDPSAFSTAMLLLRQAGQDVLRAVGSKSNLAPFDLAKPEVVADDLKKAQQKLPKPAK